jgi:hypothetical protein
MSGKLANDIRKNRIFKMKDNEIKGEADKDIFAEK